MKIKGKFRYERLIFLTNSQWDLVFQKVYSRSSKDSGLPKSGGGLYFNGIPILGTKIFLIKS